MDSPGCIAESLEHAGLVRAPPKLLESLAVFRPQTGEGLEEMRSDQEIVDRALAILDGSDGHPGKQVR